MKQYSLIFLCILSFLYADDSQLPQILVAKGSADYQSSITLGNLPEFIEPVELQNRHLHMPIPDNLPLFNAEQSKRFNYIEPEPKRPLAISQPATLAFPALDDGLTIIPPDTQGTVGLNHVMTTLNDRIRIQTKTGLALFTTTLSSFWGIAGTGMVPFDPRITYDPYNNRWIFTTLVNPGQPSSMIFLAVSQNDNPLDIWNIYHIKADPQATTTSGVWADFPSIGFNKNWIVIQTNMFNISNGAFNRSHIYALNKAQIYANGPASFTLFNLINLGGTQAPAVTYDNENPNLYLLQNWNGNAAGFGYLLLYNLAGSVGNENLSIVNFVSVNAPWASSHPIIDGGFAPQLGTIRRIMNNDSRILTVIFRNGSIWAAQTAFLPASSPTHSALQWWQINPTSVVQQFGRIQDISATLSNGTFYAFPSIAVSASNNVLLGFSLFNSTIYASSGFAYRSAFDMPNTMRAPSLLIPGLDIYTKDFGSGSVRWGDYSSTVIDPNDIDFWTLQESADTRAGTQTRWITWWGKISPI